MKQRSEAAIEVELKSENDRNTAANDIEIQSDRIRKILEEAIFKLRLLAHLPSLLQDDGEVLRQHLQPQEAEFILLVCRDFADDSVLEEHSQLCMIANAINRISIFEKKQCSGHSKHAYQSVDHYESHITYAIDILFKSKSLVDYLQSLDTKPESLIETFLESMQQLKQIMDDRLSMSALDEIQRENDLKTAYRSSMLLSENIRELEEQLEKQRQELTKEHDRKYETMQALASKIEFLRERAKGDINQMVYDSETLMMKAYNKSIELQEQLAIDAKQAVQQFDTLLEVHLGKEKVLRAKRFKVETQLASWLAKYDTDIGEKQAEYEELEKAYNAEKEELDLLKEKFDEQDEEYVVLMKEKEEEERRIYEEKAYQFLLNRSARRIQLCWRAYRERKLARKRGRKSKKKGSADKKKDKKKDMPSTTRSGPDPNALISEKFDSELLADLGPETDSVFKGKNLVVDLTAD